MNGIASENQNDLQVSVVIPVYKGADTLHPLVERLTRQLESTFSDYEILLVDDHSPDTSWNVINELSLANPKVRGILLMKNSGQHNATLCGVRAARYPITITMDDDMQHPPEEIPTLLREFQKGFDVVYGVPKKLPHSWWRNLGSKLTKSILSRVMGIPIQEIGAFRIFRTNLRLAFDHYRNSYVYLDPLLFWGSSRIGHVTVNEDSRTVGQSNYTFRSLVRAGLLILTGYSTLPLRFATFLGFLFILFGLGVMIYVLILSVTVGSVPGFPFLASLISLFAGMQLFSLGIIGEYLARVYESATQKLPYIVEETVNEPVLPDARS